MRYSCIVKNMTDFLGAIRKSNLSRGIVGLQALYNANSFCSDMRYVIKDIFGMYSNIKKYLSHEITLDTCFRYKNNMQSSTTKWYL